MSEYFYNFPHKRVYRRLWDFFGLSSCNPNSDGINHDMVARFLLEHPELHDEWFERGMYMEVLIAAERDFNEVRRALNNGGRDE